LKEYIMVVADTGMVTKVKQELVRCRDCKRGRLYDKDCVDCELNELAKDPDFFCADGVKKDE